MCDSERKEQLGYLYAEQIEKNPFSLDSNVDVFAAKSAAKKERLDRINFYKATSITNRLDFTARNAMLSLKEESPPYFLSNSIASSAHAPRLTRSAALSPHYAPDPEISALAVGKNQAVLNLRAPAYTGKYSALCPEDREILESLPRLGGPEEKLDEFLDKQKEIFLVELSLQTKQQQIDMLDSDIKRREIALQTAYNYYEREVQQFDKSVRQSDYQTIYSVLQQEQATRDRRARQEQISQTITQIYYIYSETARNELALLKYCKYKAFVAELLSPTERTQFYREEEQFAAMRRAIAISCRRFDTCNGLCLDCFRNVNGIDPEGIVASLFAPADSDSRNTDGTAVLKPKLLATACKHKATINYETIYDDEIRDFLISQKPIRESSELSLRPLADVLSYDEYFNFPTRNPGLDDYTAICIYKFVRYPTELQFNSSFEFINTMRLIESNNFYLVENLQDTDQQGERQRQKLYQQLHSEESQISTLEQQLERLRMLGLDARKRAGEIGELTETQYNSQITDIYRIDAIVKAGYEQVVQAILEQLRANPAVERLTAYYQLADPQSIGSLSMLSWMEGNLERINARLARLDYRQRFVFERGRERARRKREEALRVAAKELARQAKIHKTYERSKEPIRQCDVRDVKAPSYALPKREVGHVVRATEDETREIGFYE